MTTPRAPGAGTPRRLVRVVWWGMVLLTLGAALVTVTGLALLQARGDQVMVVTSGSMSPTFQAGDAVLVRTPVDGDLRPGQVITFHAAGEPEVLTTHRIVARHQRPEGLFLQTQGDANATPDPNFVPSGAVRGVMADSIPYLGRWLAFVQAPMGRLAVLGLPLVLLALAQTASILREVRALSGRAPGGRRPTLAIPVVAVVLVSVASGSMLARSTGALYTDQFAVTANSFTTNTYCGTGTTYQQAVVADTPSIYHRFSETSGITAANAGNSGSGGTYAGGYALGVSGATSCESTSTAVQLNGSSGQVTSNATASAAPGTFTMEAWFRTTTGGGKLIGFGNQRSAASTATDRHLYLTNAGQVVFGVNSGTLREVVSPASYLDGRWHHVAAALGASGMRLYVDGVEVASRADLTVAATPSGFWRIGFDTLPASPNRPTNFSFTGAVDEVAIYRSSLPVARIQAHFAERRG